MIIGTYSPTSTKQEGNILVPICFHACFNAFSLLMTFLLSHNMAA